MITKLKKREICREQFADGSALIKYPDGSVLILESDLAKTTMLREGKPVNYNEPPPPPARAGAINARHKQP